MNAQIQSAVEADSSVEIRGRFLYLTDDPEVISAQLGGDDLVPGNTAALRDNVSTDEITPTTVMTSFDERLGDYPYVGLRVGGVMPVAKGDVKKGGFAVVVAGNRYGKGSSRESSPLAEISAGIRLVIARSFERIYRQNAQNLGLLTSTDFGLIERIARGERIPLAEFTRGHDDLTRRIIEAGGLLALSRRHLQAMRDAHPTPATHAASTAQPARPASYARKLIDRALVSVPGVLQVGAEPQAGDGVLLRCDWRFSHEYFTGMAAHLMHGAFGAPAPLLRKDSIVAFRDHLSYSHRSEVHRQLNLMPGVRELAKGHDDFVAAYGVKAHGVLDTREGSEGICHAMMAERYVEPGQVVAGTDSHTPHSGALGALAFGAGATDIANAWVTGVVRTRLPKICKVMLRGRLQPGVAAKDVVLELLRRPFIAEGHGIGMVFEFAGPVVERMATDERATLTNMVAEMGGFTGIVAPDAQTQRFLKERRGLEFRIEDWMRSDDGAAYDATLDVDCGQLEPMFAAPGDPGNGVPFSAIGRPVRIDIAYGGSCTAGKRADFDEYFEVFSWAHARGMRVPAHVSLFLQFGTVDVRAYCESLGMSAVFESVGAEMLMPGCGACANCGPGSSTRADQVTVSAINRNFPGRSGPGGVWLASPSSVAASALAGELMTFEALKARAA
ncbi:MAG: aconitase family protein [Pseudomonadota bacterium]